MKVIICFDKNIYPILFEITPTGGSIDVTDIKSIVPISYPGYRHYTMFWYILFTSLFPILLGLWNIFVHFCDSIIIILILYNLVHTFH